MTNTDTTARIRDLNDRFRANPLSAGIPGQIVMTQGISALPRADQQAIFDQVRRFEIFTEDNDPCGEHDFGSRIFEGIGKVLWKIDYYAPDLTHGSEDPADPAQTHRVLTIMLAEEY